MKGEEGMRDKIKKYKKKKGKKKNKYYFLGERTNNNNKIKVSYEMSFLRMMEVLHN